MNKEIVEGKTKIDRIHKPPTQCQRIMHYFSVFSLHLPCHKWFYVRDAIRIFALFCYGNFFTWRSSSFRKESVCSKCVRSEFRSTLVIRIISHSENSPHEKLKPNFSRTFISFIFRRLSHRKYDILFWKDRDRIDGNSYKWIDIGSDDGGCNIETVNVLCITQ